LLMCSVFRTCLCCCNPGRFNIDRNNCRVSQPHAFILNSNKTLYRNCTSGTFRGLTAFTSPKLPLRAKCALRLALALPAQTPQSALSTLEKLSTTTRSGFGNAGLRQSMTMAVSLKMSAASRYILHSGSRAVPSRCAKRMVPMRPVDSWRTESSNAVVGDAVESPTPAPGCVY